MDKILVSKKNHMVQISQLNISLGIALCIKLPQMTGCVKCFDSNNTMSFKVTNKKLIINYTKIILNLILNLTMKNLLKFNTVF